MMEALARRTHFTLEEYLCLDADALTKHEYYCGEIYAMAGGSPEHAILAGKVIARLEPQIAKHGCVVATSDLRVRIDTGLWTYPDATVVCGPLQRAPENPRTIMNPRLVVEVTSDSTEDYDRGAKLAHYQQIPSLQTVVFVSHREPRLTAVHRRGPQQWASEEVGPHESIDLGAGVTLAVDDVYAGIDLTDR